MFNHDSLPDWVSGPGGQLKLARAHHSDLLSREPRMVVQAELNFPQSTPVCLRAEAQGLEYCLPDLCVIAYLNRQCVDHFLNEADEAWDEHGCPLAFEPPCRSDTALKGV